MTLDTKDPIPETKIHVIPLPDPIIILIRDVFV